MKDPYQIAINFLKAVYCHDDSEMSWKAALNIEEARVEKDREYLCTLLDEVIETAQQIKEAL